MTQKKSLRQTDSTEQGALAVADTDTFWYLYRSAMSQTVYPLEFFLRPAHASHLSYEPKPVRRWCEEGCRNFNRSGGCPPLAPDFPSIHQDSEPLFLICCRFWSRFKHPNVLLSANRAIHWKFQDAIMARLMANVGYGLREYAGGSFLGTGYCLGCPGRKCAFKTGQSACRNPARRTFSLEATGINVVTTVERLFDLPFHWYGGQDTAVPYMLKCMACFPGSHLSKEAMLLLLKKVLNEFKSCFLPIGSAEYREYLGRIGIS